MKTLLSKLNLLILTAVVVFVAGCDVGSSPEPDLDGAGTLEIRLHDEPGNFDEVNVFIERVEIRRDAIEDENGETEENGENDDNGANEEGWIVVGEPNQSYNLLDLTNGVYEVLGQVELEAGLYQQIRLIVSRDQNNVVIDDQNYDMFVPSGTQTGVKLNVDTEIQNGSELVVILDFNAAKSVVHRGEGNAPTPYLLKPVIKASILDNVGSISGTVVPVESRSVIHAISDSDTLTSTFADVESGEFKLMGLEQGFYTVSVEPREEEYDAKELHDIEVIVGEVQELDEINLTAENGEDENSEEDENGENNG